VLLSSKVLQAETKDGCTLRFAPCAPLKMVNFFMDEPALVLHSSRVKG
jgi:hypothetical protein